MRLDYMSPHDVRRYQRDVENFLRSAERALAGWGFAFDQGTARELFFRDQRGFADSWVLLRFPNSLQSQAFYYVFFDYQWQSGNGTQGAYIQLVNQEFQREVGVTEVADSLQRLQRGHFEGFSPVVLRHIAPANTRVNYAITDGEED